MKYPSHQPHRRNPKQEKKKTTLFPQKEKSLNAGDKQPFFQKKLIVGEPNDRFEKEANTVAGKVVNSAEKGTVINTSAISSVQRYMTNSEYDERGTNNARIEEDKRGDEVPMQTMSEEKEKDKPMGQTKGEEEKEKDETVAQTMSEEEKEKDETVAQTMSEEEKEKDETTAQTMGEEEKEKDETVAQTMGEEDKEKDETTAQTMGEEEKEKDETTAQTMGEEEKEKDETVAQTMSEEEKEKDETTAQTMHEGGETNQPQKTTGNVEELLMQTKGKGSPLPEDLKIRMEEKFGAKFHKVRIHTGEDAVALTRKLKAKAFTHGYDIYFNEGKFNPHTSEGLFLMAHELTHILHQNGSNQSN